MFVPNQNMSIFRKTQLSQTYVKYGSIRLARNLLGLQDTIEIPIGIHLQTNLCHVSWQSHLCLLLSRWLAITRPLQRQGTIFTNIKGDA